MALENPLRDVKLNRLIHRAGVNARMAIFSLEALTRRIDEGSVRKGAGKGESDGLALIHSFIKLVGQCHRAWRNTLTASDACMEINVPRGLSDTDGEIAERPDNAGNLGHREQFNISVAVQYFPHDWFEHARSTVECREQFFELDWFSPDDR